MGWHGRTSACDREHKWSSEDPPRRWKERLAVEDEGGSRKHGMHSITLTGQSSAVTSDAFIKKRHRGGSANERIGWAIARMRRATAER